MGCSGAPLTSAQTLLAHLKLLQQAEVPGDLRHICVCFGTVPYRKGSVDRCCRRRGTGGGGGGGWGLRGWDDGEAACVTLVCRPRRAGEVVTLTAPPKLLHHGLSLTSTIARPHSPRRPLRCRQSTTLSPPRCSEIRVETACISTTRPPSSHDGPIPSGGACEPGPGGQTQELGPEECMAQYNFAWWGLKAD